MDKRIKLIATGKMAEDNLPLVLNEMLVSDNLYQRKVAEGASVLMRRNHSNKEIKCWRGID